VKIDRIRARRILKRLEKEPLITKVNYSAYGFAVTFKTGIKEHWITTLGGQPHKYSIDLPDTAVADDKPVKIYREFETNTLDDDFEEKDKFFILQHSDLTKSFISGRMAVHQLINDLITEGWVKFQYPEHVLRREIGKRRYNEVYWMGDYYRTSANKREMLGRAVMASFIDWGDIDDGRRTLREAWKDANFLYKVIRKMIKQKKNITRKTLLNGVCNHDGRGHSGPLLIAPGLYAEAYNRLFGKLPFCDPNPRAGSRVLAAMINGSKCHVGDPGARELAEFFDLYIENEPDVVFTEGFIPDVRRFLVFSRDSLDCPDSFEVRDVADRPIGNFYYQK